MAEKRKRGQNFVLEEKYRLIKCLGPRKEIILNKKTDNTTNEAKNKAWAEITNEFNANTLVYRSKDSLLNVWERMKAESKVFYRNQKKNSMENEMDSDRSNTVFEDVNSLLDREHKGIMGVTHGDMPACDANKILEVVLDVQENPVEYMEEQSSDDDVPELSDDSIPEEEEHENKAARKRVPNYTPAEKALLAQLIKSKPIIVSKLTDGKTLKKKKVAWSIITDQFNKNPLVHHKRDTLTLKRAWDNLKAMARKSKSQKTKPSVVTMPRQSQQDSLIKMVEAAAPTMSYDMQIEYDNERTLWDIKQERVSVKQENVNVYRQDKNEASFDTDPLITLQNLEESQNSSACNLDATFEEALGDLVDSNVSNSHHTPHISNDGSYKDSRDSNVRQEVPVYSNQPVPAPCNKTDKKVDYIRKEGSLRIKHFQAKAKLEFEILKAKLENEAIRKRAAEMEEQTNRTLLEKAHLELLELKRRMGLQ